MRACRKAKRLATLPQREINFEALLPISNCATCVPTTVAPDSTWDGLAMANVVECVGGAIVSPHSQNAEITPQDGDYRTAPAQNWNQTTIAAMNASPTTHRCDLLSERKWSG
jgi:hypothetical protein